MSVIPLTSAKRMKELTEHLFTARTQADVESLLTMAAAMGIDDRRPIGGRENNAGAIELSSSSAAAIIERVTNGIDAVLERLAQIQGFTSLADWPAPPNGPRDAARTLLGIPEAGIGDLEKSERRTLAENLAFVLEESGVKGSPTILIEDKGVGQTPVEMPGGLLSLNRSNKLHKPWQGGAYGQGGSSTLRFSPYTIFISRKDPALLKAGEIDSVGWTVAFKDEGDPYEDALPVYRYYVDRNGNIPSFDPPLLPDPEWSGTRIVHIEYELPKFSQAFTQLANSLWSLFNSYMFDPVLPFLIGGRRQADLKAVRKGVEAASKMNPLVVAPEDETRVIIGNKTRLDLLEPGKDLEIPWRDSVTRDLTAAHGRDLGILKINYWVLRRPTGSDKGEPAESYVGRDSAVTLTLHGQRHEAERRAWLKEKLGLPFLSKNLIVQVDIDGITPPGRRELFSSTRERMVEGPMKDLVYAELIEALKDDSELKRLNSEMRERAMQKGAKEVGDKVRQKLAKFVRTFLKGRTTTEKVSVPSKVESGPKPNGVGKPSPPRPTDDSNLPHVPTDMKFSRDPIPITQGKRAKVWVYLDAKNDYLERHKDQLTIKTSENLEGKVRVIGQSALQAGKSQWTLYADRDAPLGEGELEAVMVTANGAIQATAAVRVLAPQEVSNRAEKEKEKPIEGPNIIWVERGDWDADFTEKTVGDVSFGQESTDIRVNRNHPFIEKAFKNNSLSEEQIENRAEKYLVAVGCGLFRQAYMNREDGIQIDDDQLASEQERLAEAVLIAIDDRLVELD
jgi:hypothetical protein